VGQAEPVTSRALLTDFGGVCLLTPFELHRHTERHYGLPEGTLSWMGPLDPSTDPHWQRLLAGELTERGYWKIRSAEVGEMIGVADLDTKTLFDPVYDLDESVILRPEMVALVHDVRAAGRPLAILTNDMADFQTAEWIENLTFLRSFDAIVDGSHTKVLKPDLRAYGFGCEALGTRPEDTVFVDDQPANHCAALEAGLVSVFFDVTNPVASVAAVRAALEL
jgi:putative hydrolase of the HAD superfamily